MGWGDGDTEFRIEVLLLNAQAGRGKKVVAAGGGRDPGFMALSMYSTDRIPEMLSMVLLGEEGSRRYLRKSNLAFRFDDSKKVKRRRRRSNGPR